MTVSSSTSKAGPYAGNGSTTAFAFAFYTQAAADIAVIKTDSTGADTTLTSGTDYTVVLNADQTTSPGGTVTLAAAPASGYQITVLRNITLTQGASLPNQGGWYPKVVENALDKMTMGLQQLAEKVSRAVVMGVTQNDPAALINTITSNAASAAASASNASGSATAASNSAAAASSSAAAAAASAVDAAAATSIWISGQVYADGVKRYSPITYWDYRRKGTGGGTTDPSIDTANWVLVSSLYASSYLHARDQKSGSAGGTSVAGTQTRTLNTVVSNTISGASLASNQITLPAGTYDIAISAPACEVNLHQASLYNVTDAAYALVGDNAQSPANSMTHSTVVGRITLAATKALEVRHFTGSAIASSGLGKSTGSGQPDVYTQLRIWKVA